MDEENADGVIPFQLEISVLRNINNHTRRMSHQLFGEIQKAKFFKVLENEY